MIVKSLRHHGGNISRVAESLGLSRAGALPPLREVRDHRVSFRARLVTYFVVVHLALAGLGGWLVWTHAVLAGRPSRSRWPCRSRSASASCGAPSAIGALAADAARLVHDEAFTSRFLPVGEPDVDELIALYNRMVDRLRDERVRLAEQHQFLAQVLAVSPSGHRRARLRRRDHQPEPGGGASARRPGDGDGASARRRSARRSPRRWRRSPPGESRVVGARRLGARPGAARRVRRSRLPARVLRARGADRRAAPGRAGRLREADPRDVARGEQHRRRRRRRCCSRR